MGVPAWPHSVALRKLLTISGPLRSLSSWHSSMNVLEGKGMAVGHMTASVQRPGRGRAAGGKGRWQGGVVTPQPAEANPDYPAQRGRKGRAVEQDHREAARPSTDQGAKSLPSPSSHLAPRLVALGQLPSGSQERNERRRHLPRKE